jgi:hypothetical protein
MAGAHGWVGGADALHRQGFVERVTTLEKKAVPL